MMQMVSIEGGHVDYEDFEECRKFGLFILPLVKPDAQNHGFGIANMRDTAAKYGGLLYIEQ